MKKVCVLLVVVMLAMLGMVACAPAQEQAAGAYSEDRTANDEDMALFDKVMQAQDNGKQYEVTSVSTQVVAGTNYRFKVKVTDNNNSYEAYVYIFEPLPSDKKEPEFVKEEKI